MVAFALQDGQFTTPRPAPRGARSICPELPAPFPLSAVQLHVPLVLASASPRRRQLLTQMGLAFTVQPADIDETAPDDIEPSALVRHLALEKAVAVAHHHPDALVLGADTIVVRAGRVLGKPADAREAEQMLTSLSGQMHTVFTGLALVHTASARREAAHEETDVYFDPLSSEEIAAYVATGSPLDKAGAYGIQDDYGAVFIHRIVGDYYNVVGLPLSRLYKLLRGPFADLVAG